MIMDVAYMGIFPKTSIAILKSYRKTVEKEQSSERVAMFDNVMEHLIATVINHTTMMQKVVSYLIKHKMDAN